MDAAQIEQAYEPFAQALEGGGFRQPTPDEGWSAEMIGAHVALNNDSLTMAARDLLETGTATYDNERVVDDRVLLDRVATVGAWAELATDVRRSVRDMAVAYVDLADAGSRAVPVTIHHAGQIVREGPAPLAELIERNVSYHLAMHLEQLLVLR